MKLLAYVPAAAAVAGFGYLVYLDIRTKIAERIVAEKARDAAQPIADVADKIGDKLGGMFGGDEATEAQMRFPSQPSVQRVGGIDATRGAVTVDWQQRPTYKVPR